MFPISLKNTCLTLMVKKSSINFPCFTYSFIQVFGDLGIIALDTRFEKAFRLNDTSLLGQRQIEFVKLKLSEFEQNKDISKIVILRFSICCCLYSFKPFS